MNAPPKQEETHEHPCPAGSAGSPSVGHSDHTSGESSEEPQRPENPAAEAVRLIPALLTELKAYAAHYVSAKIDGVKATARNVAIYAAMGVLGLLVAAGVIVTSVALLLVGIAHAIGALLGNRLWLGDIIAGVLFLGTLALMIYRPLSKFFKASQVRMEQKYEGKRIQERVQHGRDVSERAGVSPNGKQA